MDDLNASLCDLPVELRALVLSHIEHVKTRQILALSSDVSGEAFSLPGALPRTFDFEGVAGDDIADLVVRLLHADRVRSLGKERAVELIGDDKDRLCEYACGRNFEVLKWAHHELDLPWAPYPAGRVSDDVLVLRVLRAMWSKLHGWWPEDSGPEEWRWVKMVDGRVVELVFNRLGLTGAVPAEIGQLASLVKLDLSDNKLTSVPAEIGQLASLKELDLNGNQLTSLPAETVRLASLERLSLGRNQLTSLPAEIWQLTSLTELNLGGYRLTSVPAEIGQLTSLQDVVPQRQSADERAGGDRAAHVAEGVVPQRQSADERAGGDRAAHVAGVVEPQLQSADERAGGDRAAHVAGVVAPQRQSADERAGGDRAARVAEVVVPRGQ